MTEALHPRTLFRLLPCILLATACNGDKKALPDQQATFTVTGAINDIKTGEATVYIFESGDYSFMDISIHDGRDEQQSLSLDFFLGPSENPVEIPSVGTYTIGAIDDSDSGFWMVYTNTETGQEYGSDGGTVGTLSIEAITPYYIKGRFEFQAPEKGTGASGIMVENGQFTALVAKPDL